MRLRTVRKRFRLSGLPGKYVHEVYVRMKGIADETTLLGKENNDLWVQTVKYIFEKYDRELKQEITDFHHKTG